MIHESVEGITKCPLCGKDIRKIRVHGSVGYLACDAEMKLFRECHGESSETFVTPDGYLRPGVRDVNGEPGYLLHRRRCRG